MNGDELLKALMYDSEGLRGVLPNFAEKAANKIAGDSDQDVHDIVLHSIKSKLLKDNEIVAEAAESPIEAAFFNAFSVLSAAGGVFFVDFTPAMIDAAPFMQELRDDYAEYKRLEKKYAVDFAHRKEDYIAELVSSCDILPEVGSYLQTWNIIDTLGFADGYKLSLQANTKINGRAMRFDGLLWKIKDPSFLLVIECDGFSFHGDKDAFISDRKRDRILGRAGYSVVRYSGSEIYNNPMGTAGELVEHLMELHEGELEQPK